MAQAIKFGWVGLGQMGQSHVANLLKCGFNVTVWNRDKSKCRFAEERGAVVASSPKEVVESSDATFVMLSTPAAAREVYAASNGILAGISEEKGIIDCASLDADCMRELAGLVVENGGKFLASPVAGHSGMAADATCQLICAGDESLYDLVSDALDSLCKNKVYLGPEDVGAASNLKLVVNGLLANVTASMAEALAVAEKANLSLDALHNVVSGHALNSPLLQLCMSKMRSKNHCPPLFMLKHMHKDALLAAELCTEVEQSSPITVATRDVYAAALDEFGGENWTAVHSSITKKDR